MFLVEVAYRFVCCYYVLLAFASVTVKSCIPRLAMYGKVLRDAPRDDSSLRQGWCRWLIHDLLVPKRYFCHFYMNACMWHSCFVLLFASSIATNGFLSSVDLVSVLYGVHITRRLYESTCVATYNTEAKIHLVQYIVGMTYYPMTSLSLCLFSHIQGPIGFPFPRQLGWNGGVLQCVGLGLFLWGSYHQNVSHRILARLRKSKADTAYVIPHGGYFDLVSNPHYFFEWIVYLGLWLLTEMTCSALACNLAWIAIGLTLSAISTHNWYQDTFGNGYPKQRKIMWPFIL